MEALAGRKTLRAILELLADPGGGPRPTPAGAAASEPTHSTAAAAFPLIGTVVSLTPGESLEARRALDPAEDRFLRDHSFSRRISALDPEMTPLPVLPLTMTLEMMAEAAAVLAPGRPLIGMRNVRGHRWIAVDGDQAALRIVAHRRSSVSGLEFDVQVYESGPPAADRAAIRVAEGTMVFGESRPETATAGPFVLPDERPAPRTIERIYEEVLFHGPCFRGVIAVTGLSHEGLRATLEVLPSDGLFRSTPRPGFLVDPVLLDVTGQAVGYWATEQLEAGYIYFPFRLEELTLFDAPLPVGERLTFRARINQAAGGLVRADWEVVRADGRLWARCRGWEDRRFEMPQRIVDFLYSPRDSMLSDPWPPRAGEAAEPPAPRAVRIEQDLFPKGFFTASGAIWERTLAHTVLAPAEREQWRSPEVPAPRRIEWLLGRIAAKDAVREELEHRHGLVLCPADIVIRTDEQGRLIPEGPWAGRVPEVPALSLTQGEGWAIAVAGAGDPALAATWFTPDGG
jgi:hypothetical protein